MVKSHPDVAVWLFTFSVQYISRHMNCTSQNLKGGVLFVESAPLDRHNCEEKQINLPRPPNSTLSVCLSLLLLVSLSCINSSLLWFGFHCLNSLTDFCFSFPLLLCPKVLTSLSSCASFRRSSGLTPSNLTANEQSGCAHSQRISNPHGNPFTLYHKHSPN